MFHPRTGRARDGRLADSGGREQRRGGGTTVAGTTDLAAVWLAATDELADEIISAQQRAYLRLTRLRAIVEDTALLSVPDAFTRDVIESRLRPAITEALTRRLGRPIQVAVTVRVAEDATGRPAGTVYRSAPEPGSADGEIPLPGSLDDGHPGQRPADNTIPEQHQPGHDVPPAPAGPQPATAVDGHRSGLIPASRDGQEALFSAAFVEPLRSPPLWPRYYLVLTLQPRLRLSQAGEAYACPVWDRNPALYPTHTFSTDTGASAKVLSFGFGSQCAQSST